MNCANIQQDHEGEKNLSLDIVMSPDESIFLFF